MVPVGIFFFLGFFLEGEYPIHTHIHFSQNLTVVVSRMESANADLDRGSRDPTNSMRSDAQQKYKSTVVLQNEEKIDSTGSCRSCVRIPSRLRTCVRTNSVMTRACVLCTVRVRRCLRTLCTHVRTVRVRLRPSASVPSAPCVHVLNFYCYRRLQVRGVHCSVLAHSAVRGRV